MTIMALFAVLVIAAFTISSAYCENAADFLSDEYINSINAEQKLWEAGRYFKKETPHSYIRHLLGVALKQQIYIPVKEHNPHEYHIPHTFDARKQWASCSSIGHVRDQANCGSSWVVAAAAAMSDRVCIKSKGASNITVSAADLMECCVSFHCGFGCFGGDPYAAWRFWTHYGIPSGGDFGSNEGCRAYPFGPCPGCTDIRTVIPPCSVICDNGGGLKFKSGYTRGASAYQVNPDEKSIQIEIMEHGPVEAAFDVYTDFIHYKTGIYQKTKEAKFIGKLAVKIIGWGHQGHTPYWLAANSWNTSWGDGGYFKIYRGRNECKIEDYVIAGEVLVE